MPQMPLRMPVSGVANWLRNRGFRPLSAGTAPNDLWCADYKGEFQARQRPVLLSPDGE